MCVDKKLSTNKHNQAIGTGRKKKQLYVFLIQWTMSKEFSHNVIPKPQTVECGWHTVAQKSVHQLVKWALNLLYLSLLLYDLKKMF